MPPIRRVLVLAVDGVQSLDVMGPIETFCDANDLVPGTYRIDVVGPGVAGQITMSNGLKLGVDPLPEPPPRIDTLVVAGGEGVRRASDDPAIVDWVARAPHPAAGGGGARAARPRRDAPLDLRRSPGSALPRGRPRPRPRLRPRRQRLDL